MGRRVRGWTVKGPLAPWAAGFECWLLGRGYLPSAVFHRLWLLAAMSLWLERQGLGACELTEQRGMLFVAERRAAGLKTWASEQSVRLPLAYLREVAAIPLGWWCSTTARSRRSWPGTASTWSSNAVWRSPRSTAASERRGCSWNSCRTSVRSTS